MVYNVQTAILVLCPGDLEKIGCATCSHRKPHKENAGCGVSCKKSGGAVGPCREPKE